MKKILKLVCASLLGFLLIACQVTEPEELLEFNLDDITFNVVDESLGIGSRFITLNLTNNSNRSIDPREIIRLEYWSDSDNDWITLFDINEREYILEGLREIIEPLESSEFQELIPYQIEDYGRYRIVFEISVIDGNAEPTSGEAVEFSEEIIELLGEFNVE
ncbi:MAG: hypothetical protein FWG67_06910 [Defluviitaleaceae bacterium]|nr:hypothetical protein [Defluviitaleaceae bacterium]